VIYVDNGQYRYRRMIMCHMLADTIEELHRAAQALGMRREWFQPMSFPHYDLSKSTRRQAVALGALEIERREVAELMRRLRTDPAFVATWKAEVALLGQQPPAQSR